MAHEPRNFCANVLGDKINKAELFYGERGSGFCITPFFVTFWT